MTTFEKAMKFIMRFIVLFTISWVYLQIATSFGLSLTQSIILFVLGSIINLISIIQEVLK